LDAALRRRIAVIPVLVADAAMPSALPSVLRPLLNRERPVSVRDGAWKVDVRTLLDRLEELMIESLPRTARQLRERFSEAALAGVVPAFGVAPAPPTGAKYFLGVARRADGEGRYEVGARKRRSLDYPLAFGRHAHPVLRLSFALLAAGLAAVGLLKWLLGWFVAVEPGEVSRDQVLCTVFAPPFVAPGQSLLVQVFAHLAEQAADAAAIAEELDTDAQRRTFQSLLAPLPVGGRLDFELRMPGLEVDDPVASLVWQRRPEAVQFGVRVPPETLAGAFIGTVDVSLNAAPVGHVKFKLVVADDAPKRRTEPQGESARRYTAAFISYASKDRDKVLARVQMLSVMGVRYFQDLLSIEPGERWEKKLELGIDECDLFLLFWSSESKRSEWVRKEVRYALARRGDDEMAPPEIRPVIVEGPPIIEPWEELAHLHFNDRLLYFMSPPPR